MAPAAVAERKDDDPVGWQPPTGPHAETELTIALGLERAYPGLAARHPCGMLGILRERPSLFRAIREHDKAWRAKERAALVDAVSEAVLALKGGGA